MGFCFVSLGSKVAYTGERVSLTSITAHRRSAESKFGEHCQLGTDPSVSVPSSADHCSLEEAGVPEPARPRELQTTATGTSG